MSAEQQGRVFRKELEENRGKKEKEKLHITDSPIKPNSLSAAKRPHSLTGGPVSLPHNNRGIKTKQQTQHTLALLDPLRPVFIYGKARRLQTLVPIPPRPPGSQRRPTIHQAGSWRQKTTPSRGRGVRPWLCFLSDTPPHQPPSNSHRPVPHAFLFIFLECLFVSLVPIFCLFFPEHEKKNHVKICMIFLFLKKIIK